MRHEDITFVLDVLRTARSNLANEFCVEDPYLYRPMFNFKAASSEMDIAIKKHMLKWLSEHNVIMKEKMHDKDHASLSKDIERIYLKTYRKLCEYFISGRQDNYSERSHVLEQLVSELMSSLDDLLQISERSENSLERLRYHSEKSRHLFENAFNNLLDNKP